MRSQWFNPLEQTPEGLLLKDVRALLKEVKNKKKADLNDDGQLSSYEKKRGKAIEASMAKKRGGYKSDRGQGPPPKLPKAKKNKTVIKFDASDNCPLCGANPHEECRMPGPSHEMRAIDCKKNPVAFDSRLDDMRQHSMAEHLDEGHSNVMIRRSDDKRDTSCSDCGKTEIAGTDKSGRCYACRAKKYNFPEDNKKVKKHDKTTQILIELGVIKNDDKNTECDMCKNVDCMGGCGGMSKADMSEKDKYCQKKFGRKYSKCTPKQQAQCDRECGKDIKKYSQESSVENLKPIFENVDGGKPVRAHGFTTNGTYPATNDGPQKSIVSETAKIPSVAQKGYTVKSSSLHMHYNDAGGSRSNPPNIDTIEQRLASLTKHAGRNNLGIIGEIEGLLKQVKDLTESPSN